MVALMGLPRGVPWLKKRSIRSSGGEAQIEPEPREILGTAIVAVTSRGHRSAAFRIFLDLPTPGRLCPRARGSPRAP